MEGPLVIYFIGLLPLFCFAFSICFVQTTLYSSNPHLFQSRFRHFSTFSSLLYFHIFYTTVDSKILILSNRCESTGSNSYMTSYQVDFSRLVSHRYPTNLFMSISLRAAAVRKQSVCSLGSDLADVCNSNPWN